MNWLLFLFAFEMGMIPHGGFVMYECDPLFVEKLPLVSTMYTDLSVEFQIIEIFYIDGSVRIPMFLPMSWNDPSFQPHATYYDFQTGAKFGPVDIFWHHTCRHPQMTYMYKYKLLSGWEGSYDEIGIRVEGQIPLIKGKEHLSQ